MTRDVMFFFVAAACLLVVVSRVTAAAAAAASQIVPNTYLPRLPVGEFRVVYDALYPCENTENHRVAINLYFSKKSRTETEIVGNVTFKVPFDDALNFELNVSSWNTNGGGWLRNSYVYRSDKLCSNAKKLLGNIIWGKFSDAFVWNVTGCPVPKGTYVSSGLDVRTLDDHALPKVYFYGKYKLVSFARIANDLVGCTALEIRLVRPWEMPKN